MAEAGYANYNINLMVEVHKMNATNKTGILFEIMMNCRMQLTKLKTGFSFKMRVIHLFIITVNGIVKAVNIPKAGKTGVEEGLLC